MNDEHFLAEWLRDTAGSDTDPSKSARQVMAQVPKTRQRGRWWPLPSVRRSTPSVDRADQPQPTPISATNGHTPTVTRRTQSMFSPAKAITAGALIFALGGVLLIAQPFDQQGGSVPGAATDTEVVPATWVTGNVGSSPTCEDPTTEDDAGVQRERGWLCEPQTWTSTDPRLTGEAAAVWNADVYITDEGVKSVIREAYYVRNDAGGWACPTNALGHGSGLFVQHESAETLRCVGDGEYEGLSAILSLEGDAGPGSSFVGIIFPGDFPPLPEPPAAE